jgi:hypothetical protein
LSGDTVFHGVITGSSGQLRIERPAVAIPEERYPAVEAELLGLLVDRVLGGILGQELLQVMRRGVRAAEVLEAAARGEAGADGRAARELIDEEAVGLGKFEGDGVFVDLAHLAVLAVDLELEERRGHDVLVEVDVLVPEHEVVGGQRPAVRPLGALAQVDRGGLAIVAHLPVAREARDDLRGGVVEREDLVCGNDAVAVLVVGRAREGASPVAAVLADLVQRLDHKELRRLRQALVDRRQLARLHERVEHWRFLEGLGVGVAVEDDGRALELADERGAELR